MIKKTTTKEFFKHKSNISNNNNKNSQFNRRNNLHLNYKNLGYVGSHYPSYNFGYNFGSNYTLPYYQFYPEYIYPINYLYPTYDDVYFYNADGSIIDLEN